MFSACIQLWLILYQVPHVSNAASCICTYNKCCWGVRRLFHTEEECIRNPRAILISYISLEQRCKHWWLELWFQQEEKTEACKISNSFKIYAFTLARIGLPWTYKVEDFRRTTCLLSLSSVHDWTLSSKLTAIFRAIKALVLHILSSEHCLAMQQLIKIPKPQINLQLAVQKWLPGI